MNGGSKIQLVGEFKSFHCPANPKDYDPAWPGLIHYMGIAGLGEHAAELALSDPRAGFLGYDRSLRLKDIKDGTSTTMAFAEAMDGGYWTAGGWATVQGLVPGDQPYLGEEGQFSSQHKTIALLPPSLIATNVAFVDGSVRSFTTGVSPCLFEALATIAGGEELEGLPEF